MANLEIGIGADVSEFNSEISKVEKQLQTLERRQEIRVRAGLDTGDLNRRITETRANLDRLRTSMNQTSQSASNFQRPVVNAGNTLTNFSRIAQDAPFGIMGIGNNLTATAESFASLSRQAGGAGNALRAVASSMLGTGGILLAVSLVTTALTIMSQKGLTVGDVFNKLTGNFDEFARSMSDANKEAAKNSSVEISNMKALVSVAQNETLARNERLIAVKELQKEYPAYFSNLSNEEILNGNVSSAVNEATQAIIAKAKAQAYSNKIGELAIEQQALREKEAIALKERNDALKRSTELQKLYGDTTKYVSDRDRARLAAAIGNFKRLDEVLQDIQNPLRANIAEQKKWQDEINKTNAAFIKLKQEFKEPPKTKKTDRPDIEGVTPLRTQGTPDFFKNLKTNMFQGLLDKTKADKESILTDLQQEGIDLRRKYGEFLKPVFDEIVKFNQEMNALFQSSVVDTFGGIGEAIGQALASGGNVMESVGMSIVSTMGSVLSAIGDKLIALGAASLLASTVFSTFGTALGVGAALAAIAGGVALKAGGSLLSGMSQGMSGGGGSKMQAGNSVTSPTSSTNFASSGGGFQNVVFEISGQSLVGVLSNTLNKNVKLGGTPAI